MRFIDYPQEVKGGIHPLYAVELTEDPVFFLLLSGWVFSWKRKRRRDHRHCPNFATASLLVVRDTFKNPWMVIIYSIFVITACYHAFYGLWTASITGD